MKFEKVMKNIVDSWIFKKEVGTSFQLGFPYFTIRNNELFVSFFPHIEKYTDNKVYYYKPCYELEMVYPFRHTTKFRNLCYSDAVGNVFFDKPVCSLSVQDIADSKDHIDKLFLLADDILDCMTKAPDLLSLRVNDFEKQYKSTIECMGLQFVYGG